MGGKILFVDDYFREKNDIDCIQSTREMTMQTDCLKKQNDGECIQGALDDLKKIEDFKDIEKQVEFAKSFEEAVRKIVAAGDGADYSWFFLDRNLESFSDVKNELSVTLPGEAEIKFSQKFFECFKNFEGDYLYFLLRKAGVPIEKICFLTGNDPNNSVDKSLKSTPFVFGEKTPEVIRKGDPNKQPSSPGDDDADPKLTNAQEELVKKIRNTLQVQLRSRYSEIFKHETKLNNIFGNDIINRFLGVLEKIEKGQTQKDDGVVFRNMVEKICSWLGGASIRATEPRAFMNNIDTQNDFAYSLNYKNFEFAYKHLLSMKEKTWRNRLPEWKDLQDDLDNNVELLPGADAAAAAALLCYLNYYLQDCKDIPKYFIACLDHVYTLTSEFSAHGKSDVNEADIPWRALADDMITILKWCVANNPPQYNKIEVTLRFNASKWPSNSYKINDNVTLNKLHQGSQNQCLPQGKIIKIESV